MDMFDNGQGVALRVSPSNPLPVAAAPYADGSLTAVPAGSTNGTALDTAQVRPSGATGVEIILPANASITYTIATAQPTGAPASTATVAGTDFGSWPIALGPNTSVYVTAITGSPSFRWL